MRKEMVTKFSAKAQGSIPSAARKKSVIIIYMCLVSYQKAEICMTITFSFHNSQELGACLSCRQFPAESANLWAKSFLK